MSNRAHLLNTSVLTSDVYQLYDQAGQPGHDFAEVAEGVYRIPVPWPCMFRPADLRPVQLRDTEGDGQEVTRSPREILLPCTTVKQAIRNLEQCLSLFEQITGEKKRAREFWQRVGRENPASRVRLRECLAMYAHSFLLARSFSPSHCWNVAAGC